MDLVPLLKAAHRPMAIEEIEQRLNRGVSRLEMAKHSSIKEVAKDVWQYERAWMYVVDKASLVTLLQGTSRGIEVSELRNCYATATFDLDALTREGIVTVIEDKAFYSHPEFLLPIGEDVLHGWHTVHMPQVAPPATTIIARKKSGKRSKVDRHNEHVGDLW